MKAENRIQQECVREFRNRYCLAHHSPRYCIFSVPNETKDMRELQTKKQTGLLSGVSDLIVILPNVTLFLECKDDKGTQQPNQKEFEKIVTDLGHYYGVFRSLEEFNLIINLFIS